MDELVIADKKYLSSKQAAKVTGYAKDYIGQLCREGRVPARLVGRSWYVLESAIRDHRFGEPKNEPVVVGGGSQQEEQHWESPRYEASEADVIPPINQLQKANQEALGDEEDGDFKARMQETWQAWFDRFEHAAEAVVIPLTDSETEHEAEKEQPKEAPIPKEEEEEEEEEIQVPIRAIEHPSPIPQEFLVRSGVSESAPAKPRAAHRERGSRMNVAKGAIKLTGVLLALCTIVVATLSSGYFDEYIASSEQVGLIAGVGVYER